MQLILVGFVTWLDKVPQAGGTCLSQELLLALLPLDVVPLSSTLQTVAVQVLGDSTTGAVRLEKASQVIKSSLNPSSQKSF